MLLANLPPVSSVSGVVCSSVSSSFDVSSYSNAQPSPQAFSPPFATRPIHTEHLRPPKNCNTDLVVEVRATCFAKTNDAQELPIKHLNFEESNCITKPTFDFTKLQRLQIPHLGYKMGRYQL